MSSSASCYAVAHQNPQGEGDARPPALQVIRDEELVHQLTDKVVLVTGSHLASELRLFELCIQQELISSCRCEI
jgi:UTP-glucose-1-phosphate uridylyltransferase